MPTTQFQDFSYCLDRTLEGEGEIEITVEVKHYRPASEHKVFVDSRDPAHDDGSVQFGDAVVVSTGRTIELTRREIEAIEEQFWNQ